MWGVMKITKEPIPDNDRNPETGFTGTDKTVIDLDKAEIAETDYVEIRVDGVFKGVIRTV